MPLVSLRILPVACDKLHYNTNIILMSGLSDKLHYNTLPLQDSTTAEATSLMAVWAVSSVGCTAITGILKPTSISNLKGQQF